MDEYSSLNVRIEKDTMQEFRIVCIHSNQKVKAAVNEALELWTKSKKLELSNAVAAPVVESGRGGNSGGGGRGGRRGARSAAPPATERMPMGSELPGQELQGATPLPTSERSMPSSAQSVPADADEVF